MLTTKVHKAKKHAAVLHIGDHGQGSPHLRKTEGLSRWTAGTGVRLHRYLARLNALLAHQEVGQDMRTCCRGHGLQRTLLDAETQPRSSRAADHKQVNTRLGTLLA